jgi:lin2238 protein
MSVVSDYKKVKEIYQKAAEKGWVIPCICSENLTTTEAIFSAAEDFAVSHGLDSVPVTIAMTVKYSHRPQATYYTHSRRADIGLRCFRADAEILSEIYPHVTAMLHLDHVQPIDDSDLLNGDLSGYASIMYDASAFPFEQNIKMTSDFVDRMNGKILIEGACDEIYDAGGSTHNSITTAEDAKRFIDETRVDLIVCNLGTEHRASGKDLKYYGDAARKIRDAIGEKIVLHGTSSVTADQIKTLFADGVCKVNIWTAVERDSSPVLLRWMAENASLIGGAAAVDKLIEDGYLGNRCKTGESASLKYFTTEARQQIVFEEMKKIVRAYFDLWYV